MGAMSSALRVRYAQSALARLAPWQPLPAQLSKNTSLPQRTKGRMRERPQFAQGHGHASSAWLIHFFAGGAKVECNHGRKYSRMEVAVAPPLLKNKWIAASLRISGCWISARCRQLAAEVAQFGRKAKQTRKCMLANEGCCLLLRSTDLCIVCCLRAAALRCWRGLGMGMGFRHRVAAPSQQYTRQGATGDASGPCRPSEAWARLGLCANL